MAMSLRVDRSSKTTMDYLDNQRNHISHIINVTATTSKMVHLGINFGGTPSIKTIMGMAPLINLTVKHITVHCLNLYSISLYINVFSR